MTLPKFKDGSTFLDSKRKRTTPMFPEKNSYLNRVCHHCNHRFGDHRGFPSLSGEKDTCPEEESIAFRWV